MTAQITLVPRLDLPAAVPLARLIADHRGEPLEIDARDVTHLGGICLQVLLSAAATWRGEGVSLSLPQRSENFDQALAIFGIAPDAIQSETSE